MDAASPSKIIKRSLTFPADGSQLDYIHHTPVKRGYVDQPEHWRYSSSRNYAGEEGLIEVMRAW